MQYWTETNWEELHKGFLQLGHVCNFKSTDHQPLLFYEKGHAVTVNSNFLFDNDPVFISSALKEVLSVCVFSKTGPQFTRPEFQ